MTNTLNLILFFIVHNIFSYETTLIVIFLTYFFVFCKSSSFLTFSVLNPHLNFSYLKDFYYNTLLLFVYLSCRFAYLMVYFCSLPTLYIYKKINFKYFQLQQSVFKIHTFKNYKNINKLFLV